MPKKPKVIEASQKYPRIDERAAADFVSLQEIVATARKNSITRMLQDSVTNGVLEQTSVPVEIIAGDDVSTLERWGLPAGLGAAIALLIAAAD